MAPRAKHDPREQAQAAVDKAEKDLTRAQEREATLKRQLADAQRDVRQAERFVTHTKTHPALIDDDDVVDAEIVPAADEPDPADDAG